MDGARQHSQPRRRSCARPPRAAQTARLIVGGNLRRGQLQSLLAAEVLRGDGRSRTCASLCSRVHTRSLQRGSSHRCESCRDTQTWASRQTICWTASACTMRSTALAPSSKCNRASESSNLTAQVPGRTLIRSIRSRSCCRATVHRRMQIRASRPKLPSASTLWRSR